MRASRPLVKAGSRRARLGATVLVIALLGFLVPVAPPAVAVPAQGWLGLTALQGLLNASPAESLDTSRQLWADRLPPSRRQSTSG